jgi:hypothetical protein
MMSELSDGLSGCIGGYLPKIREASWTFHEINSSKMTDSWM